MLTIAGCTFFGALGLCFLRLALRALGAGTKRWRNVLVFGVVAGAQFGEVFLLLWLATWGPLNPLKLVVAVAIVGGALAIAGSMTRTDTT